MFENKGTSSSLSFVQYKKSFYTQRMALSGDHVQSILVDSTYRNRKRFPHPTDFELTSKPDSSVITSDPLAKGYIIHSDVVVSYGSTSPNRIEMSVGITEYENSILGMYIEVLSPTYSIRGVANIVGFAPTTPTFTYVYLSKPIPGVIAGDLIYIRQIQGSPLIRFLPVLAVLAGETSVQISNGSRKINAYKGFFLRNMTSLGIDYVITGYEPTTGVLTFSPGAEAGGFAPTDYLEIYGVDDNEGGLSEMGSVSNRSAPCNHEVRLNWLRIPRHPLYVNNTLDTPASYSLTVNNFAYLIVEFHNKSYTPRGIIQSNNIHTRSGQFIVPIEDLSTGVGKFYTLRCPTPVIMRYSPNDIYTFRVTLPNGQTIQFDPEDERADTLECPNPDMQVIAHFSVQRILH